MTNKEQHELRLKIAKQLKLAQASLTFLTEEDLVALEAHLKQILQKLVS